MKLTDHEHWEKQWSKMSVENAEAGIFVFHDILKKYLPDDQSYLEIGCAPGRTMCYFNKYFSYNVSGLDYTSLDITREVLKFNNIKDFNLYEIDFTNQTIDKTFDVVASWGFVEHFNDVDLMIEKQMPLLNSHGYLIVEIPNFRKIQYLLHYIFDGKETIKLHNTDVMDPTYFKKLLEKNDMEILFCDYYKTFDFWIDNKFMFKEYILKIVRLFCAGLKLFRLDNIPNRYFSPYILIIAKKKR